MKQLALGVATRPLLGGAAAAAMVFASTLFGRFASSSLVALGLGCVVAGMAALLVVGAHLARRGEFDIIRSVGRVRDYRQSVSIYDNDSGLYADWYLGLRLQEEVARSRRYGQSFALLLIEDTDGGLGEMIKRLVFQALTEAVRNTDIVAHLTDRRFAVLLTNTDRRGAYVAADRVRERLPLSSVSVGLASYPEDGQDVALLLAIAGASPALTSAITRGSGGTRTSIMQSDWVGEIENDSNAGDVRDAASMRSQPEFGLPGRGESPAESEDDTPSNIVDFPQQGRICAEVGCGQAHHARGLCARHYATKKRQIA